MTLDQLPDTDQLPTPVTDPDVPDNTSQDLPTDNPPTFDATSAAVNEPQQATAAITADPQDVYRYQQARAYGFSHDKALEVGDHGIGTWGDLLATYKTPMVELPADTPGLKPGGMVKVTGPDGSNVLAKIAGLMPNQSDLKGNADIHLNPAAAMAINHPGELMPVTWQHVSDTPQTASLDLPKLMSSKTASGSGLSSSFGTGENLAAVSKNKDGSWQMSNGWNMWSSGDSYRDEGDTRYKRDNHGNVTSEKIPKPERKNIQKDSEGNIFDMDTGEKINPPGFVPKSKIFKDSNTGLAFDVSDINNPKPMNLPGNPASVDLSKLKKGDWDSVPEDIRDVAQNIAQYKYPKLSGFALRSPYFQQMFRVISKVDPTFDYRNYDSTAAFLKNFSGNGKIGQNILAFDTALDHMGNAFDKSEIMSQQEKQAGVPHNEIANKLYWEGSTVGGAEAFNNYKADADTFASEYSKVLGDTTGGERESWRDKLIGGMATVKTDNQRTSVMREMAHNLGSRLGEIQQQYKRTMGKDIPYSLLSPEAEATLKKLGANDIVEKYGSDNGKKPFFDPNKFEQTQFPGGGQDQSGAPPNMHQAYVDDQGNKYIEDPNGKMIPYGSGQ